MAANADKSLLVELGFGAAFRDEIVKMLSGIQMFDNFHVEEMSTLAHYMHAYKAQNGAIIYRENERAGHLCLLVDGKLEVYKSSEVGSRKKIADVRAGKTIGEMSIIDGLPNSATVRVAEPSILILLTKNNLIKVTENHPVLGVKLLWHFANLLSQRLRQTSGRLVDFL